MIDKPSKLRGRGAAANPVNRFTGQAYAVEEDLTEEEPSPPQTEFFRDFSRTILATNDSPDIPFRRSLNPYRGCEHGCAYCYARPTHEYFGFSAGLDFETKIVVKYDAPELLRKQLSSRRWRPQVVAMSGVTDPYQPVERRLKLTRRCLQVFGEFRNPVAIVTKNHLITRDIDLLQELARYDAVAVHISITSLDQSLTRILEPRTSAPQRRLEAVRALSSAGIPTGVLVAPVIPGLTDHEVPAIVAAAAAAGAVSAGWTPVRLPFAVGPLFEEWLERHLPDRKQKVLNRIRSMRDGKLNSPEFGERMQGHGPFADLIRKQFEIACRRAGLRGGLVALSTASFRIPEDRVSPRNRQLKLFD